MPDCSDKITYHPPKATGGGTPGPTGPTGPTGPPGTGELFVHEQSTPSSIWTVVHGLGRFPVVAVTDYSTPPHEIIGDVEWTDGNTVTITFSVPQDGWAYLVG
jgi:hypothetical protein